MLHFATAAPTKRPRSIKEAGTSSQALSQPPRPFRPSTNARTRGNVLHSLSLTNLEHVARYTCLNEQIIVATHYYDEELLGHLGSLDDKRWLFARRGTGHFIKMR